MGMRCTIASEALSFIRARAHAAASREACGLLLGRDCAILTASETANGAPDPLRRFEIDPAAIFAAQRSARAGGPALIGYWHSHPSGNPRPSATDAAMADPDGRLWLIVGGAAIGLWRAVAAGAVEGRFDPVAWDEVRAAR